MMTNDDADDDCDNNAHGHDHIDNDDVLPTCEARAEISKISISLGRHSKK